MLGKNLKAQGFRSAYLGLLLVCNACAPQMSPHEQLVEKGRHIFFNEEFEGNGRTCGTCHRAEDNFKITPEFIATLPADDPLFVAESNPQLANNFEKPEMMRQYGLILMNPDGFHDLEKQFVMRTPQSLRALRTSIGGAEFEGYENQIDFQPDQTGWAGDGAPGDGTLRSFALGAVRQHMTRSMNRTPGIDFRLPTEEELDALLAFMLSLGRQDELSLPLKLRSDRATRGQALFLDPEHQNARCSICHINAGASSMSAQAISLDQKINLGNIRHTTGEERLPGLPNELLPLDDGFGNPGDRTFNTPSLIEAADSGRLFHNGAVATVEEAVAIYNLEIFNESETGSALARRFGHPTDLDPQEVLDIAAFLRVINARDNILQTQKLLNIATKAGSWNRARASQALLEAWHETEDAILVLQGANLHPIAVASLRSVLVEISSSRLAWFGRKNAIETAERLLELAIVEIEGEKTGSKIAGR
jgi:cytochrome c peroxidase